MRGALEEIRDVANVSEGVQFYAMLAEKALPTNAATINCMIYCITKHWGICQ